MLTSRYKHTSDEQAEPLTLDDFKQSWMAKNNSPAIFISATKKENIEEFRKMLYDKVVAIHTAGIRMISCCIEIISCF